MKKNFAWFAAFCAVLFLPASLLSQSKPHKEVRVPYALGGSTSSNNTEELEETRRVYTQVTPGLPVVTLKAMENMISSDRMLSTMNINGADVMDLSFLKQLEEERKAKR